jgi:hypothetical protein
MDYLSNKSVDSFILEFLPLDDRLEALRREEEIFGESDDLPADEWAIVFESNLPHEEMMIQLRSLRASKRVECRSFEQRTTWADRLHGRALGIRVD